MTSSNGEFKGSAERRRAVQETAEEMAAHDGGDVADHLPEADRITRRDLVPYRDDDLEDRGFAEADAYNYTSIDGRLLYQSVRYEHEHVRHAKKFRQRSPPKFARNSVQWISGASVKVPYNWPALHARPDETIYFTEGEKDADRLMACGLLATTLAGQNWSLTAAKALAGRHVVVLVDNDNSGRKHAAATLAALHGFAASVKRIDFQGELERTQDVSDWLDAGHNKEELLERVRQTPARGAFGEHFNVVDATKIPTRKWLYKPHYVKRFASLLAAASGAGKTALAMTEAVAIAAGRALLHNIHPRQDAGRRLNVWYINLEDPQDELDRRAAATCQHFGLDFRDVGAHLFLSSSRAFSDEDEFKIADMDPKTRNVRVNEVFVDNAVSFIRKHQIDVVTVDPFVACHRVNENDNAAIERVVKTWTKIAEQTNCAVLLVHHSKKPNPNNGDASVDDQRGASALLAAARNARILNVMTKAEAEAAKVEVKMRKYHFREDIGKTNLMPPAEVATWYRLQNVRLHNGDDFDDTDEVQVATQWTYPIFETPPVGAEAIMAVQAQVREQQSPPRYSFRANDWVGNIVARVLNLNAKNNRKMIRGYIAEWIASGILIKIIERDGTRQPRECVQAGHTVVSDAPQ